MNIKINTSLPVCLSDGTPARIVATDRKTQHQTSLVVLVSETEREDVLFFKPDGTIDGLELRLMNTFVYEGLKQGMKLNPGHEPADWDKTRNCTGWHGKNHLSHVGRWTVSDNVDDVVLYWPKPVPFHVLELTKEETQALARVLNYVGGSGGRMRIESIRTKLHPHQYSGDHLQVGPNPYSGIGLYFQS